MIWKFNSICELDYKYTTQNMFDMFIVPNVSTSSHIEFGIHVYGTNVDSYVTKFDHILSK